MTDTPSRPASGWHPDHQATFCATIVDEWVRCGLLDAVVCPGSRSTPLAVALWRDDRVRVHVHHDERSGSHAALGLAQITGRPTVVLTTSGTAAVELHPAVVEADLAGVPLLVCTADRPPELHHIAAPQTVDQQRLYGRSLRWFVDAGVPDLAVAGAWRSMAARAWVEATADWPGPVQVNLPFREPLLGTAGALPPSRGDGPWHRRAPAGRLAPSLEPSVAAARGVVIAGRGTHHVTEPDAVVALAATLGWPLLADPVSGCRHRSSVAAFDALLRTPFADRVAPEVVLRIGAMPASKALAGWLAGADAEELVVAPSAWWPDPGRRAALVTDALPAAPAGHRPVAEWTEVWRVADAAAQGAIDRVLAEHPLSEPAVARALTRSLPPGAVLCTSSSMPVRDVEWYGIARADLRSVANRGANGIDGVVSTAVGVALTGARTTLLIGDIAFLHDANGLIGLRDRGVDLNIVVVDNDGGGIFHFLPQREDLAADEFEGLFGTPHGTDVAAVARAHGLSATVVAHPDELGWEPGTRVQVVRSARDENVAVHDAVHAAVAAALRA